VQVFQVIARQIKLDTPAFATNFRFCVWPVCEVADVTLHAGEQRGKAI
jgi:hypothetical protein